MIADSDVLLGRTAGGVWLVVSTVPKKEFEYGWGRTPMMHSRLAVGCVGVVLALICCKDEF